LETKKDLDFLDVPVVIEILLYKSNEIDRKIVVDLEKMGYTHQKSTDSSGDDVFFCTLGEMKDLLRRRSYASKIKNFKLMNEDELIRKVDSTYFLYNLVKNFTSLRILRFKYLSSYEHGRIVQHDSGNYIGLEYKIKYGFLDMANFLSDRDLDFFNRMMIKKNFISKKYMTRSPYFVANVSDIFECIESYMMPDDLDEKAYISYSNVTDIIFELLDPKIEADNSLILVKTDYPDL
jgi:hypothetical protein